MLRRVLGNLLGARRSADEAAALLQQADRLESAGQLAQAVAAYRDALVRAPTNASAWNNLGWALQRQDQLEQARDAYRRALEIDPGLVITRNNLGTVHRLRGEFEQARQEYDAAIARSPDDATTHLNLGTLLLKQGEAQAAEGHLRKAADLAPNNAEIQRALLLAMNYFPDVDHDAAFQSYRAWGERLEARVARRPDRPPRQAERRLRIGYLSPDFRAHAVTAFFEPALEHHDRTVVEIFCYDNSPASDAVTERLKRHELNWRPIGALDDEALARMVENDGIDVLVDLAGHTGGHRLEVFARHPAPVQASLLGYLNTTGLSRMDYRISDALCDPPGDADRWHTEKLWRLPGSFWCWRTPRDAPDVSPLPARSNGHVTFGSFNNFTKLNRALTDAWIEILLALPTARLLVAGAPGGTSDERFIARFSERGIDAARLELVSRLPGDVFRRLHHRVDIALDAFPYSGGATTCESLWMGVPVLTLAGALGFERSATGILTTVGLEEWVCHSRAEYVSRAIAGAGRLDALASLRSTLRERVRSSPLADGPSFARRLEAAYRGMSVMNCR